ncbi:MAG: DNA polymerase III subunit delta' [Clostridia bacterium]|nr:DNA polymerase III subunit delta' [Clostridia bacterium]
MSFKTIIGHEQEKSYFKKVIRENNLSHALLLEGPSGIGKKLMAFTIAKALFCDHHTGEACDTCRNCIKMNHGNHPDYSVIEADGNQIKNAQIEAFQEFVNVKPYDAEYKVVVIDDAEKMNLSSQNRILKTLEEPAEDVVIIMVSDQPDRLLPTVLSRAQQIKMNGLSDDAIISYLKSHYSVETSEAEMIAKLASGSIGRSILYLESEIFEVIRKEVKELLIAIDLKDQSKLLELNSFFIKEKENIHEIIEYMILWYRDLLLYKKSKLKQLLIHGHELDFIKKLARNLSIKQLISNIESLELTKKKLDQHGNYDLTIDTMLVKLLEA